VDIPMSRTASGLWRATVVTHRYLGVAVGILMVMWFVSGIVMMYVGFPRVTENDRMRTLLPIAWQACCAFGDHLFPDNEQILRAQVENLAKAPVMRIRRIGSPDASVNLAKGSIWRIDADEARAIAAEAARRIIGRASNIVFVDKAQTDQWTVGRLFRDRPLFRFVFDDPERTNVYVSGTTGQIVHWTTATQRFWNWLGTIPHWLYFANLRSNVALWSEIVIWTSVVGTFLTVIGLYLGIMQVRLGGRGRISPYRGWFYWHHLAGLLFGIVTLTWVVSGLISMNPWGFLQGRRDGGAAQRLEGAAATWSEVRASLDAIRRQPAAANAASLVTAPFGGRLYWLASQKDGTVTRLDAAGNIAAVTETDLAGAARRIAGAAGIAEQAMVGEEDAYYYRSYQGRDGFVLPVYRVVTNDEEHTRYYLDPNSGALLQRADSNRRWHRWLFTGLHRIDFAAWMRVRPVWDMIVLTLMLGGLGLTATGFYLSIRRIRGDVLAVFRRVAVRRAKAAKSGPPEAGMIGA
jgi:hypothetical protein